MGVPIKAPPTPIKAPPAMNNFVEIAFLRLALEILADPRRCVDTRRRNALEDRIWLNTSYQLATYKCATMREHAAHGSPIHTRKLDP